MFMRVGCHNLGGRVQARLEELRGFAFFCLSLAHLISEGIETASPGSSVAVPTNQPVAVPWVLL